LKNEEVEEKFNLPAGHIYNLTGVKQRHVADKDQCSSDLAFESSKKAIADAKIDGKDIDLILFASSIGDMAIPTTSSRLQKKLGLMNSSTFDVNFTCMSFIAALDVAKNYIAVGKYKTILIAAAEITSKVTNWDEGEARYLLGDGAASVVLSITDEEDNSIINSAHFKTDSTYNDLIHIEGLGNKNHPNSSHLKPDMNLFYMNGPAVLKQALRKMDDLVNGTMKYANFKKEEIDFIIPHQASIYGIRGAMRKAGFDMAKTLLSLEECGNTAAASMPITLDKFVKNGTITRGDKIFFLGTAAGLSWGGVTIVY
jgi:3-oxoacyl-[acyl-carrier-protein] synthase-3